jgi:hypothetical protein
VPATGFTTVNCTVLDPNNLPYSNGTWSANFVDPGTPGRTPLINGGIITRVYAGDMDVNGTFTVDLPDNVVVGTQSGALNTQWTFAFASKSTPTGVGQPPTFQVTLTITGSTQNISAAVQAAAAAFSGPSIPGEITVPTVIPFSATPVFAANPVTGGSFKITLSANVTASSLTGAVAGQLIVFQIVENGTGGWTFVWPSNVKGAMAITTAAGTHNQQLFIFDGTNAYPLGPGTWV